MRLKIVSSHYQRGQTIIEILIATGVIALVMTAIASGLTLSVKNTSQAKYRALASKEAQEGVEMYRRERSRLGWESFQSTVSSGTYCLGETLPSTTDGFTTLPIGACSVGYPLGGTTYTRESDVSVINADEVEVTVTVSWIDSNQERSTAITQRFQNWN